MAKCNYCGRESDAHEVKQVGGYLILECCTDCEVEILADQESNDGE